MVAVAVAVQLSTRPVSFGFQSSWSRHWRSWKTLYCGLFLHTTTGQGMILADEVPRPLRLALKSLFIDLASSLGG